MTVADLDVNKVYTYADYLKWQIKERVELIKGKIFEMSAPNRMHQKVSTFVQYKLSDYLVGKKCEVYSAPFDVRLYTKSKEDKDILTTVQPDLCVVCDLSKLDYKGCLGAPDIVVEILSPGNNVTELKNKYELYEQSGITEYWIISPQDRTFLCYTLRDGKYQASRMMVAGDVVRSEVLDGFALDLGQLFEGIS